MKKHIKTVLLLVMAFVLTICTGCTEKLKKEAEPLENGTLRVGMNLKIDKFCYLPEENNNPQGFEVEVAKALAKKAGLKLEIVDTTQENLLKSLDGKIYDCVISAVGIADWNDSHYSHTKAYADISKVEDQTGVKSEYTEIAVFTRKNNPMVNLLDEKLESLKKDGTLEKISRECFDKDIIIK